MAPCETIAAANRTPVAAAVQRSRFKGSNRFTRTGGRCDDGVMTLEEFRETLSSTTPTHVAPLLRALWHDARGQWQEAHRIAQDVDDNDGAWVHAYLHRKEGDLDNAAYWYQRASLPVATDSLDAEWTRIAAALLR
jgi:hypothetical protein